MRVITLCDSRVLYPQYIKHYCWWAGTLMDKISKRKSIAFFHSRLIETHLCDYNVRLHQSQNAPE
jgi:hypothetical protein